MPEIFGDDLATTIRAAYGERAPVLLLSSLEPEELARRAAEAGVRGWVTKREGMDALLRKIKEVLG
jgi:DNA-binding NarL/FixJ family response regulator